MQDVLNEYDETDLSGMLSKLKILVSPLLTEGMDKKK